MPSLPRKTASPAEIIQMCNRFDVFTGEYEQASARIRARRARRQIGGESAETAANRLNDNLAQAVQSIADGMLALAEKGAVANLTLNALRPVIRPTATELVFSNLREQTSDDQDAWAMGGHLGLVAVSLVIPSIRKKSSGVVELTFLNSDPPSPSSRHWHIFGKFAISTLMTDGSCEVKGYSIGAADPTDLWRTANHHYPDLLSRDFYSPDKPSQETLIKHVPQLGTYLLSVAEQLPPANETSNHSTIL